MDRKSAEDMFHNINVCTHLFCLDCIGSHVAAKIKENIIQVKCPDPNCKALIGPEICRSIVPKEVLERWEDSLCESLILGSQKFYCPFKDCSAMLVNDGGETVTSSECPNCNRLFCAQCKVVWHSGMDCRMFQSLKEGERDPEDIMLMDLAKNNKWRRCPSCKFYVEKTQGCLHIACRCGFHFCYGCERRIMEVVMFALLLDFSLQIVDDFYFSALLDDDQIFPISDEKYAEQLQLQEALIISSSSSKPSNIHKNASSSSKGKRKQPMEEEDIQTSESRSDVNNNNKFSAKIKDNITMVKCPHPRCKGVIGPELCRSIIPKQVLERWEDSLCESLILGSQKFYCPFKDCSVMLLDDGDKGITSSECPSCNRLFCAKCKVVWHSGMGCKEFQSLKKGERDPEDIMLMELAKRKQWRRRKLGCELKFPKCEDSRECTRCGYHFCYGCGKEYEGIGTHACRIV
ncbi:hypothetical protein OSB04_005099 [Centaurea solstitialis]|uniref:RBR-type E3 ubiquitin transferase n=1 Tax=Centaurea solstitialis TaxID=347529 RepID=A0AA38WR88_9ASTR|nr:hypothetical protein OSB04_005099 [Centaurea solstitialis]